MTMTVRYNASANRALNQTNKNDKARSKALGKFASGMKINSAQDDAASFSISARMPLNFVPLNKTRRTFKTVARFSTQLKVAFKVKLT